MPHQGRHVETADAPGRDAQAPLKQQPTVRDGFISIDIKLLEEASHKVFSLQRKNTWCLEHIWRLERSFTQAESSARHQPHLSRAAPQRGRHKLRKADLQAAQVARSRQGSTEAQHKPGWHAEATQANRMGSEHA